MGRVDGSERLTNYNTPTQGEMKPQTQKEELPSKTQTSGKGEDKGDRGKGQFSEEDPIPQSRALQPCFVRATKSKPKTWGQEYNFGPR